MVQKYLEKAVVGAALAVAATTLLPIAKNTLRPLADMGIKGATDLAGKTKTALQLVKEEIEDIVAEAQFERMKKQWDKEIASDNET